MAATEIQEPRTYGNWRKPTSAGILGLGTIGTALLLVGLVVVVLTALIGGLLKAVVLAAVLAVLMVAVLSKDRHGRNVVSRASARSAPTSTAPGRSAARCGAPSNSPDWRRPPG